MSSISRLIASPLTLRVFRTSSQSTLRKLSYTSSVSNQAFKTDLHTDNLYPGSNWKDRFLVKKAIPEDHPSGFNGVIDISQLQIKYDISDANGSATKVTVQFHLDSATWLSDQVKQTLKVKLATELAKDGFLVAKSDRTRSQLLNQADAIQKLRHAIWAALEPNYKTYLEITQSKEISEEKKRKVQMKSARERIRERKPEVATADK